MKKVMDQTSTALDKLLVNLRKNFQYKRCFGYLPNITILQDAPRVTSGLSLLSGVSSTGIGGKLFIGFTGITAGKDRGGSEVGN